MLFDLRGSGRRTTVKVVYITLAVLMGGGLVFFGIGGDVQGGLFDAISNQSSDGQDSGDLQKRADAAQRQAEANPQDPAGWAEAVRARYQLARAGDNVDPNTGQFTAAGVAQLRIAADNWEKHLALEPDPPDDGVASIMVRAYITGLNEPAKAVTAQEIITEARPKSGTYADLATLAFEAGQTNKGDLAMKKALELAEPADRETLKAELEEAKTNAITQQLQNPTATPTATPKAGGNNKKNDKNSGGKD
jgi:hypothetical protein